MIYSFVVFIDCVYSYVYVTRMSRFGPWHPLKFVFSGCKQAVLRLTLVIFTLIACIAMCMFYVMF